MWAICAGALLLLTHTTVLTVVVLAVGQYITAIAVILLASNTYPFWLRLVLAR